METVGPAIYGLLAKVMSEVGVVGKSRKNTGQGYQFRGLDDVVAAVQPVLAANGVLVVPRVVEREREEFKTAKGGAMFSVRLLVEHTFYAPDGSSVVCTTLGESMDSGDKASNKAMSAALKYALTETLMIPTYEADRDIEDASPEVAHHEPVQRPPQQHRPPPNGQGAQPPGREPGADDGDDERLAAGVEKARTMAELRALVGLRDKVTAKNTQHPLWTKFVAKYRELEAAERRAA
jgi:hypothetical protein